MYLNGYKKDLWQVKRKKNISIEDLAVPQETSSLVSNKNWVRLKTHLTKLFLRINGNLSPTIAYWIEMSPINCDTEKHCVE